MYVCMHVCMRDFLGPLIGRDCRERPQHCESERKKSTLHIRDRYPCGSEREPSLTPVTLGVDKHSLVLVAF